MDCAEGKSMKMYEGFSQLGVRKHNQSSEIPDRLYGKNPDTAY